MGRFARVLTGLACKRRKKAKPSQRARASLLLLARALQGLANCCSEDEAPRVQATRHLRKDRRAIKTALRTSTKVLATHPLRITCVCVRHEGLGTIARLLRSRLHGFSAFQILSSILGELVPDFWKTLTDQWEQEGRPHAPTNAPKGTGRMK